jgi:hypothetical protein
VTPSAAAGDVSITALKSDQTTILGSFGPFALSSGAATIQTNLLPSGTAFVQATYGGDSTHALSVSVPLPLAVSGTNSATTTTAYFVGLDANNNPISHTTSSQSFTYGTSGYILQIVVKGPSDCTANFTTKPPVPCPTGTVALTDNGQPLNDFPNGPTTNATNVAKLNNLGIAEDVPINVGATVNGVTPGVHMIVATYTSADGNYTNSTSNTLQITVKQAATTVQVASSLNPVPAGTTVLLTAAVGSASSAESPCGVTNGGTVAFTSNGTALAGSVTYTAIPATSTVGAACTATLSTTVSALYPPTTRSPRPTPPLFPIVLALLSIVFFALGWRWMPEKRRRTYAYAGFLVFALLAVTIAGCGGGGGSSSGKTVTIKANYVGDMNYAASSGTTNITVR